MGRAGAVRLREGEVAAENVVSRLLRAVVQKRRHSTGTKKKIYINLLLIFQKCPTIIHKN